MHKEKTITAHCRPARQQPRAGFSHRILESRQATGPAAILLTMLPSGAQPASTWQDNFSAYFSFMAKTRRKPSHYSVDPNERLIAKWAARQRQSYRDGTLPDNHARLLREAGFDFAPKRGRQPGTRLTTHIWGRSFAAYFDFIEKNGEPSGTSDDICESSLAVWARAQRRANRDGTLSGERRKALADAGFDFDRCDAAWNRIFAEFVSFAIEKGRLPAHDAKDQLEKKLYGWRIRQFEARSQGTLGKTREKKLNDFLFFSLFDSSPFQQSAQDANWEKRLSGWLSFIKEHGKPARQKTKDPEESSLGRWGWRQRYLFKHNLLDPIKAKRLADAGFDFRVQKAEGN